MPRRPADQPRAIIRTCRFTDAEDAQLEQRAAAAGFGGNVSAYIRAASLTTRARQPVAAPSTAEAEGVRLPPPPQISAEQYRVLIELLRRAGVNVNQLARFANTHHALPPDVERELRTAVAEIRHVVRLAQPA